MERKLDTDLLVRVGKHSSRDALQRAERIRRRKQVSRLQDALRVCLSGFCAWFAICHIDVITKNGMIILEAAGVIACIGVIASTVSDIWEKAGEPD
jgi:hypothetical protein